MAYSNHLPVLVIVLSLSGAACGGSAAEIVLGVTASGGILYLSFSNDQSDVYRIGVDGNGFAVLAASSEQESVPVVF